MRPALLLLAALLSVQLCACGTAPIRGNVYIVQSGDTLYSIATRSGMDYRQLARLNNIDRDYRIYPGQRLQLVGDARQNRDPATVARNPAREVAVPVNISWLWPTHAQTQVSTTRPNGGLGLLIHGQPGQDVVAAASGQVIYSGSGLPGYGRLLIIKHDEVWLSVYGHLQQTRVNEGTQLSAGQPIASMGADAAGTPLLYFEIRNNGQPVAPLPLLPKQNSR